ncbi:glutaminyl-tRNA synthase (glutamine-hydrolyzing) subunit B [Candidatus Campbellbacteria bacterium RIFOXYC2_FULL_35_25]|uniref:Aspartyl/glutamyl-tRNA(Asn/Gln) amidotransferase subunit B n=1 Tax=Candidatus Campbellbacteria bacterium RIFOXYC2_FULL_35_25 TaxID=1797582 RepID=A0A1F5EIG9_9BACT|nr:MAG: glutaminyl-tRNA synthase (glutamine-hydrolyzing) subunit B [Candidatus Campbellbacteria bacterium RIFOXYC2_FULL_35_25]
MKNYKTTIGLEIHAELKTRTKMFCNSKNDPDEIRSNMNVCPVCMAHPGTLPVMNKEAVKSVLKVGLAIGGKLADFTEFDRKNYFYPDIPKGYQISQYKYPLVSGGNLKGVEITRVHLEEDTAKSTHDEKGHSLVDFNRAGIPLMELVTEPVVGSAQQASAFARELQLLLRYLGVGEANMEKGEMRIEANISVSDNEHFGTKVEVKNLNSFKVVEKAIDYEVKRQIEVLEEGGEIIQETRGWDENKQKTFSQRVKEGSADYRYFPDPDLPKLKLSEIAEFNKDVLENALPELPWEKRERFLRDFGIKEEDVEMYVIDETYRNLFEAVVIEIGDNKDLIKLASNYITSDLVGMVKNSEVGGVENVDKDNFSELIKMVGENKVSSRGAKDILKILFEKGGNSKKIAEENNLLQKNDISDLKNVVEKVIIENQETVKEYKKGKETAIKYLMGQAMKATKGSANPKVLQDLLKSLLKE